MRVPILLVSTLVLLSAAFPSGVHASDNPKLTPLVAEIIAAPQVVAGSDGKRHIVYELALTNINGGDVEKLEVVGPDSGATLAELNPGDHDPQSSLPPPPGRSCPCQR